MRASTREKQSDSARTRSFGGCSTCRSRHMKCDEGRPSCSTCVESGQLCGGYEKSIFFNSEETARGGAVRFRRPMLTQEERRRMSDSLTSSIPPKSALRSILQIDDECENSPLSRDVQVYRGPFGAFRLARHCNVPLNPSQDEDASFPELVIEPNNDSGAVDMAMSPATQQLLQSIIDDVQPDDGSSSLMPQFCWNTTTDSSRVQEILDDASLPDIQDVPLSPISAPHGYQFPPFIPNSSFPMMPIPIVPDSNHSVPQDAVSLLQHYSTTVLNLLTPFRHTKTPWHILFIPNAKNCLAALTLGEKLDHANLSMFYGTLAVSAFSLGGISQSETWLHQAQAYKQLAREHTRLMLKTAYDIPKVSKYKSILMALVTMVQVSMFSGNRDQTECYFLEAERFIRLKGLNRPKSRKVRLLHHLYAFERIFHESMVTTAIDSHHRHHVRKAIESSGLVIHGQDSLSFQLPAWEDLQQEMCKVKGQLDGENDLHLERPGIWPATLHPEIFGMPEPWLIAMSLIVRLGREKDAVQRGDTPSPLNLKDFLSRARAIEKMINQLQWPSHVEEGLERLLGVMQTALAIYFYRRVYDVDTSMLQPKVIFIRDCLLQWKQAGPTQVHASARFIWPALIAAREAEDPEIQASFSSWFKSCARESGFQVFTNTLGIVSQTWGEKQNTAGTAANRGV